MKHLTPALARTLTASCALAAAVSLAGCASSSGSTAGGASSTPAGASTTWTGTSEHAGSPAPASSAPAATSTGPSAPAATSTGPSAPAAPTSSPPRSSAPSPLVPPAATSAEVTYLGPKAAKPVRVAKHVTGLPYEKLATTLDALDPAPAGTVQCMVLTGENATVTISSEGHTWVYRVDGAGCRPVVVTKDGASEAVLTNSATLLKQIRAIAGFTGMAHPLTG